jgi:hypothetical protein
MAVFDKLYLANRMLLAVGAESISSLGKATKGQRLTALILDGIIYEAFSFNIPLKFATTRAQLDELSTTPVFGWEHQFGFPAACVRILSTVDEQGDDIQYPYRREVLLTRSGSRTVETDVLLTNQDEVFVRYVFLRANPAAWPGWFQRLVILHGAMQLVAPIQKDDFTALNIQRQFVDAYSKAKGANASEDIDTGDQARDLDMGNTDFVDAVQDSRRIRVWNTSSLNRD